MFKAELSNPNILKTSFDAISSIVDEVQIQTDSEGFRLDALDRSHITFVHLELKSSLFDEFVCDEPEKINIDTDEFMKVLKRSKSTDRVIMSLDEGNFIITFEGEAKRTFKIRLIDIEYESPTITLMVDSEKFRASAEGEFGDANIEYIHGEKIDTEAKSVFSLEKIREMLKADKFSEMAIINLGTDIPLYLTLRRVDGEGELSFLLAPRIESED